MPGWFEEVFNKFTRHKRSQEQSSPQNSTIENNDLGHEQNERPETKRLREIVLWSFFVSQGDPTLQKKLLSNVVRLHPELITNICDWARELNFKEQMIVKEDDRGVSADPQYVLGWHIDERALELDPSGKRLLADVRRFVLGVMHPEGSTSKEDSPFFYRDLLHETSLRVSDLMRTTERSEQTVEEKYIDSLEECAHSLIQREVSLMNSYMGWQETLLKNSSTDKHMSDLHERLRRRIEVRRDFIGVSLLCKYALSDRRMFARPKLPPELMNVMQALGVYIRAHKDAFLTPQVNEKQSSLAKLIEYWNRESKPQEKIEL